MATKIVFIHGFGEDHTTWNGFIQDHFSFYSCEKPDFSLWEDAETIRDYAKKIGQSLDDHHHYILVGHSMGGYIALELGQLFPNKILQIILLNSTFLGDSEEKKLNRDKVAAFLTEHSTLDFIKNFTPNLYNPKRLEEFNSLIQSQINRYQHLPKKALIQATLAMKNRRDFRQELKNNSIPVSILAGKNDSLINFEQLSEDFKDLNPINRLIGLENVGHQAIFEEPKLTAQLIKDLINPPLVIAMDGHSSCGKSSTAKKLAAELSYVFVDTGAMYRAVALYFYRNHLSLDNLAEIEKELKLIHVDFRFNSEKKASDTYLNGENVESEIRKQYISEYVSQVSSITPVRKAMVALQQKMGQKGGIVMDGRDIGTVVFPQADIKIYMTAKAEIRAARRKAELDAKGEEVSFEEILENLKMRDQLDMNRTEGPLKKADDAIVLDTSNTSFEEQVQFILDLVNQKIKQYHDKN